MAPAYTITDLGTLGGSSQSRGFGINNCGKAVGDSIFTGGSIVLHPFYKKDAVTPMTDLGTLGTDGTAYSINSLGYTVGYSTASIGQRAILWHDNNDNGVNDPGELQDFFPPGATGVAYDINDSNHIVGLIDTSGGQSLSESPFVWDATNGVQSLPTPPAGMTLMRAVGINNAGNITGWASVAVAGTHAFILKNNVYIDLGALDTASHLSFAARISEDNHVVGYSQTSPNNAFHAFVWSDANNNNQADAGEMIDLGTLSGTNAYAWDINSSGYVVGTSDVTSGGTHAYVWHDDNANGVNDPGEMKDLNGQISDPAWTNLVEARSINDLGQIVGWGTTSTGETHAFLLTPAGGVTPSISNVSGSGAYSGTATLTATLTSGGTPLNGKTISFTVNGNSVGNAATNTSGVATLSGVSLSGISIGTHPNAVGASFVENTCFSANGSGTLTVSQGTPVITWNNPANITYGISLSGTQLNAVASVPGTFSYTPTAGTVLHAGNAQTLHVDFTPTDTTNYTNASKNVLINVTKATPVITWTNPSDITYGTALGSSQLNATATNPNDSSIVAGSFTYNPASATVLHAGNGQTLHADFAPTDTTNYNTPAQKTVSINVLKASLTITADNKVKLVGDANPALTFTPTGFVNGDSAGVLSGAPSLTTTATQSSPVGSYPITITQGTLSAADYMFTFVNGTLVISEPAPVILLETGTNNAAAVDSVTFVRGPFSVTDNFNFSGDHVTRVIIFTAPLVNPNDGTLKVFASGRPLQIESFGSVTGVTGLNASYIVVKLDPVLIGSGPINYDLTISLHNVTSNTATLTIIP